MSDRGKARPIDRKRHAELQRMVDETEWEPFWPLTWDEGVEPLTYGELRWVLAILSEVKP